GCYGDGGAIMTNDEHLAKNIQMIANHGQAKKYFHQVIGCNSRLDSIQAAILSVKLPLLDEYAKARNKVADQYDQYFSQLNWLSIPKRTTKSTHVFHQYTLQLPDAAERESLQNHLAEKGIPSMIYYPIPLHLQEAFKTPEYVTGSFPVCEELCQKVLSLPIHTEMEEEEIIYIVDAVKSYK
ncbi:MAG TPA: DegT/DnrJ/EryC1/StrS family aminotransferase, partial [Arachidicoccus soli]|nr:DegT/DnrJ/EryC1/StrS family aminotransferase [Arachidicoccus soli]